MEARESQDSYPCGIPIEFSGYVEDFECGIAAVQFSLDDGAHWTNYETTQATKDSGISWKFSFTPPKPGVYVLKVRALSNDGISARLVSSILFRASAIPAQPTVQPTIASCESQQVGGRFDASAAKGFMKESGFRLASVGRRPLCAAGLFRSSELADASLEALDFVFHEVGVRSVYDIRSHWEVSGRPDPLVEGVYGVSLEPSMGRKRKDANRRLVAGVIGEYGAPEQRMCSNYRRYVREYPLIGSALRSVAQRGEKALIHCANGKDRTGVLCAVASRIAGMHADDILADYLFYNVISEQEIDAEFERLSAGMTRAEQDILRSFLEARPSYLQAFFDEIDWAFGNFEAYVREGLHLDTAQRDTIARLVQGY